MGVEMFRADKQTDMTKLVPAFRSSAKESKKHLNKSCRNSVWKSNPMTNKVYITVGQGKHSSARRRPFSFSHATKSI